MKLTSVILASVVAFAATGLTLVVQRASAGECTKVLVSLDLVGQPGSGSIFLKAAPASDKLTYSWTVSAGTIVGGQGTPDIIVDAPSGEMVTAKVVIVNFPKGCANEATLEVKAP